MNIYTASTALKASARLNEHKKIHNFGRPVFSGHYGLWSFLDTFAGGRLVSVSQMDIGSVNAMGNLTLTLAIALRLFCQ